MALSYAAFQIVLARSDPRTVLLVQQPFESIYPHIVTMAQQLQCPLVRYPPSAPASRRAGQQDGDGLSTVEASDQATFADVFDKAFDDGAWLVVDAMSRVGHSQWRHAGARLAVVVPTQHHHMRRQFRLFAFLPPGHEAHVYAPPILCQFALLIDPAGAVSSKSTHGPLFSHDVMIDDITGMLLSNNTGRAGGRGAAEAARDGTSRTQPYMSLAEARGLAATGALADDRPGAMTEEYVDEVLAVLREDLLHDQNTLIDAIDGAIAERVAQAEAKRAAQMGVMGVLDEDEEAVDADDTSRSADRLRMAIVDEETQRANDDYAWLYPRIAAWCREQHPALTVDTLQVVRDADIVPERLLWQTTGELCHEVSWAGASALLVAPITGYNEAKNEEYRAAARAAAAVQSSFRHPHVLGIFGCLASAPSHCVMEHGSGTLEQVLAAARQASRHWTVGAFLSLAQQVLRALVFISHRITHRDIACHSVVVTGPSQFKLSRFQCATPLKAERSQLTGLVPIRWAAPEALRGRFSPASDVWSFGIMMWEALHYATELPYAAHPQAAEAILDGDQLPCSTAAARVVYALCCEPCFEYDPSMRPTASALLANVDQALFMLDPSVLRRRVPFPTDPDADEETPL